MGTIESLRNMVMLSAKGMGKGAHCLILSMEASNSVLTLVQMVLQFLDDT
jgi:hypothetical protein